MSPSSRRTLLATVLVVAGLALVVAGVAGLGAAALDRPSGAPTSAPATSSTPVDSNSTVAPPEPVPGLDLPERVELDGTVRGASVTPSLDVGAAVHRDAVDADAAYETSLLESRLERASTQTERQELLEETLADANETARSLRDRERVVRSEYQAGEITTREFVARLQTIHVRAEARQQLLDTVDRVSDGEAARTANVLGGAYLPLTGEVRSDLAAMASGEQPPRTVYVASSNDGTVLATVSGSTYHREAIRDDHFVNTGAEGVSWDEMQVLLEEDLYPEFRAMSDWSSLVSAADNTVYQAMGTHTHGRFTTYLDANTEDVFREYQQLDLDGETPTHSPLNASAGSLTLEVERTYPSGPARVTVTDDGQPVADATIVVADHEAATTGEDGTAWVVLPYDTPDVVTTANGARATVTVTWSDTS